MKQTHTRRGFTLIELLVVVLIIGILAAVALPQYQAVVVKGRVGAMLPIMDYLSKQQEIYYMQNGSYAPTIEDLQAEVPEYCSPIENTSPVAGSIFSCNDNFTLGVFANGMVNINYCPGNTTIYQDCIDNRTVHISFRPIYYSEHMAESGLRKCSVYHNSALATKVCGSLPFPTTIE